MSATIKIMPTKAVLRMDVGCIQHLYHGPHSIQVLGACQAVAHVFVCNILRTLRLMCLSLDLPQLFAETTPYGEPRSDWTQSETVLTCDCLISLDLKPII